MTNYTSSEVLHFFYFLSTLMDSTSSPPTSIIQTYTSLSPQVPSNPGDILPLTLSPATQRNGIKSTCQNVFHLIYLTLRYDTKGLLSGVAEPSEAVWLNHRVVSETKRLEDLPTSPPGRIGDASHHTNIVRSVELATPASVKAIKSKKISKAQRNTELCNSCLKSHTFLFVNHKQGSSDCSVREEGVNFHKTLKSRSVQ